MSASPQFYKLFSTGDRLYRTARIEVVSNKVVAATGPLQFMIGWPLDKVRCRAYECDFTLVALTNAHRTEAYRTYPATILQRRELRTA
jgi:hypothetical protein